MNESPQIVIRTRRPEQAASKTFTFTPEMIRRANAENAAGDAISYQVIPVNDLHTTKISFLSDRYGAIRQTTP